MSRNRSLDIDPRDAVELRDDRPERDDHEPADFDDRRIAERFGEQGGGFFAFETFDYGMGEW